MELKERVIEAVIEEFNDKGIKFTMDDVARRLGISKRTLYTVIKDKEVLFIEAVDHVFDTIKDSEREIIEDNSIDIIEKLKKLLVAFPQKYKTIDYRQLYDLKYKFPRIYAKIESRLETEWEPTFSVLEQGVREGRIKNIEKPVFQAIVSGTIEYFLSRRILIDNNISYEEALNQMLNIIFSGICM